MAVSGGISSAPAMSCEAIGAPPKTASSAAAISFATAILKFICNTSFAIFDLTISYTLLYTLSRAPARKWRGGEVEISLYGASWRAPSASLHPGGIVNAALLRYNRPKQILLTEVPL